MTEESPCNTKLHSNLKHFYILSPFLVETFVLYHLAILGPITVIIFFFNIYSIECTCSSFVRSSVRLLSSSSFVLYVLHYIVFWYLGQTFGACARFISPRMRSPFLGTPFVRSFVAMPSPIQI